MSRVILPPPSQPSMGAVHVPTPLPGKMERITVAPSTRRASGWEPSSEVLRATNQLALASHGIDPRRCFDCGRVAEGPCNMPGGHDGRTGEAMSKEVGS